MIGVFDSGIGGLGIFKEIKNILPQESILYYADTKNVPYGNKTRKEITKLVSEAIKFLNKKVDIIVLACNTASTMNLDYFRTLTTKPVIGTVPVIKTAAKWTTNKKIALLATPQTIKSKYIDNLIKKFAKNCQVKKIACQNWVKAIEENKVTDKILNKYLKKIGQADIVVLGCTHYTLIRGHIQRLVGPDVKVLDSNEAVARHVLRVMLQNKLFKPQKKPKYIFINS